MSPPTIGEEYASLMAQQGEGRHLYTPVDSSQLRPGIIGYFDDLGDWNPITDLLQPEGLEAEGFTPFRCELAEPKSATRGVRSSGKDAEYSFGLSAGISGALSSAPIDVSAEGKNSISHTGKAALVTEYAVTEDRLTGAWQSRLETWMKANKKALLKTEHASQLRRTGLVAICKSWTTPECAIIMSSGHNRDTSGGFKIGATGIGNLGPNASVARKLESKGWTAHKAKTPDQKLAISFAGVVYIYRKLLPSTMTVVKAAQSRKLERDIVNDTGDSIGTEYCWPVVGMDGTLSAEWVKVLDDKAGQSEVPKPQIAEDEEKEDEGETEAGFEHSGLSYGIDMAEIRNEDREALYREQAQRQALISTFIRGVLAVEQDESLDTAVKRKNLQDLLDANKDVAGAWVELVNRLLSREAEAAVAKAMAEETDAAPA